MPIPQQPKNKYNERVSGVFGEFGAGGKRRVRYIQTNLQVEDLDSVKMVADLPGNEQWTIRELFQREVDETRVETGIVKYLTDEGKVKFFNPLTFVLLGKDGGNIGPMASVEEHSFSNGAPELKDGWQKYYETADVFRLKHSGRPDGYAELEWNSKQAEVVAIDGQHRLLALKKIKASEDAAKIAQWKIPVVILLISPEGKKQTGRIIDSVRKLFLYINKEAHQPNETRQIILDEENVNEMCVQEMLQHGRTPEGIPLLAYDWRGIEEDRVPVEDIPYTLFSAVYMRNWLHRYILGDNYSKDQRHILGIAPEEQSLFKLFSGSSKKNPSEENAEEIRGRFRERVMPGITHFVTGFTPYKGYVDLIREISDSTDEHTQLALNYIRFGGTAINHRDAWEIGKIKATAEDVKRKLSGHKNKMPHVLVNLDIGGFGVFYAFGNLFYLAEYSDFQEYAKSVTSAFNKAWAAGNKLGLEHILSLKDPKAQGVFRHIIYDHSGRVRNNRLTTAHKGLGALITLVVTSHWDGITESQKEEVAKMYLPILRKTLESGYKKQFNDLDTTPYAERDHKKIAQRATTHAAKQIRQIQESYGFGDFSEIPEREEESD